MHVQRPVYVMLNKPAGFLSSRTDPRQRDTVFDLLPADFPRVFHVGRLDQDSEGLLLLTNDGDLSLQLTHPRYKVEKEYEVILDRPFDMALAEKLLAGVFIAVDPPQPGAAAATGTRAGGSRSQLGAAKVEGDPAAGIEAADSPDVPGRRLRGQTAPARAPGQPEARQIAAGRMAVS